MTALCHARGRQWTPAWDARGCLWTKRSGLRRSWHAAAVPSRLPSRPILPRPQIKPGLRQVWRDRSSVQIGLTPDVGVVLAGLEPGEADLLPLLDGTRDADELAALASARGLRRGRVEALVEVLGQAGVLTGAPTDRAHLHQLRGLDRDRLAPDALAWSVVYPDAGDGFGLLAQRARHSTLVVGSGRLALATEAAVARTGVPVHRCATLPSPPPAPPRGQGGQLALLVGEDAVAAPAAATLLGAGIAHLAATAGADRAVVGPLVIPGRSACLRCLELHRTDRDPLWPTVAAQLAADLRPGASQL